MITNNLEHKALTNSNILVGHDGLLKIGTSPPWLISGRHLLIVSLGGVEHCCLRNSSSYQREMNALAVIMMELMEKDTKESGLVGVNDLERWPSDSEAVEFLSATTSSDSINQLKKVRHLAA